MASNATNETLLATLRNAGNVIGSAIINISKLWIVWHYIVIMAVLYVSLIIIFPIYITIFRTNRERDRKTTVYPITNHFYKTNFVVYFLLIITSVCAILASLHFIRINVPVAFGSVLITLVHSHSFILSILAIQRFLLYFFPASHKYIAINEKVMNRTLIGILIFFYLLLCAAHGLASYLKYDEFYLVLNIYFIYLMILNAIFVLSAVLYIPMIISIYKLQQLSSTAKHQPHKYILYQTLVFAFVKTIEGCSVFILHIYRNESNDMFLNFAAAWCIEIVTTPFLIQVTYLFCNKRDVDVLRKKTTFRRFWSGIFGGNRVGTE
ncbi:hypothetical protein CRE_23394 [Caenorhabditis remanei]|uniref:Serpentine Receptor, class Z n=1 Tax=Caenorhabditis remanei TaxID=31234 RepID=E3MH99_CAERE|nr:hypothetical protein CRE_23394 [Caenorhabditis remanei]